MKTRITKNHAVTGLRDKLRRLIRRGVAKSHSQLHLTAMTGGTLAKGAVEVTGFLFGRLRIE